LKASKKSKRREEMPVLSSLQKNVRCGGPLYFISNILRTATNLPASIR